MEQAVKDSIDLSTIRRGVITGASFMVLLRVCFRIVGVVSTLILVHLLSPDDFGLFGFVTGASGILDTLSQLSLQYALLRIPQPTKAQLDTAWTLGLLRSAVFALMLAASAPFLSQFVHDQRLPPIVFALSVIVFLQSLENITLVEYQREFRYDRLFLYQLAGKLFGFVIGLGAAFILRNYWALVLGTAAARLCIIPLGYAMRPFRPRLDLSEWKMFFHFSKWLMVTNTLWVIDGSMIMFVVGRITGAAGIGLYQIANQIGSMPASEIGAPIRDPAAVGYARASNSPTLIRQSFLENMALLVAVVMPLSVGMAIMAEPITLLFLGEKWAAAAPIMAYCAAFAFFDAVAHFSGALYIIIDRQKTLFYVLAVSLTIRVPLVILMAQWNGITGAMAALTISAFLNMFIWNGFVPRNMNVRLRDILHVTWRSIVASGVMALAVYFLMAAFPIPAHFPGFVRFTAIVAAGAVVLFAVQFSLWIANGRPQAPETLVLKLAAKIWHQLNFRRRAAIPPA